MMEGSVTAGKENGPFLSIILFSDLFNRKIITGIISRVVIIEMSSQPKNQPQPSLIKPTPEILNNRAPIGTSHCENIAISMGVFLSSNGFLMAAFAIIKESMAPPQRKRVPTMCNP